MRAERFLPCQILDPSKTENRPLLPPPPQVAMRAERLMTGLLRGRLLTLVLLCHRAEALLLTSSPAARLSSVGGDSPLVRPLEGPEFFDACSSAHPS